VDYDLRGLTVCGMTTLTRTLLEFRKDGKNRYGGTSQEDAYHRRRMRG